MFHISRWKRSTIASAVGAGALGGAGVAAADVAGLGRGPRPSPR